MSVEDVDIPRVTHYWFIMQANDRCYWNIAINLSQKLILLD